MINTTLKFTLIEKGISQLQLSHDLKIDPAIVSKIIRGWIEPSEEMKDRIAIYLGKEKESLFSTE